MAREPPRLCSARNPRTLRCKEGVDAQIYTALLPPAPGAHSQAWLLQEAEQCSEERHFTAVTVTLLASFLNQRIPDSQGLNPGKKSGLLLFTAPLSQLGPGDLTGEMPHQGDLRKAAFGVQRGPLQTRYAQQDRWQKSLEEEPQDSEAKLP
ncbi:hypothetical protein TREES_T100016816 [Tupaia chinensis]|uniref:Uncharacterized protein n=1 Tax=Tupaia chinensis TaxID=246437 RepID=L9L3G8_TUPCH|nr:hypothetical protein TREES_T100016816 [Tupaia chinensis]